jgi:hypothetical protein
MAIARVRGDGADVMAIVGSATARRQDGHRRDGR